MKGLIINLRKTILTISVVAMMLFAVTTVSADDNARSQHDDVFDNALAAALKVATKGPTVIPLLDQAKLNLPKNYVFIPHKEAVDLMDASGSKVTPDFFGLILPYASGSKDISWVITIDFHKSGYVKDDEAKQWDADRLLESLKKGTSQMNEERSAKGFPTLSITGWLEAPMYHSDSHKLIWSILGRDSDGKDIVNYNTYALGREGYFELTLLSSYKTIAASKIDANKILSSLDYDSGKRYEDFVKGKDHIAEYGIAALITGIAAKKLGLLALVGVFIAKIWKMLMFAALVFFGRIKKVFSRKSTQN